MAITLDLPPELEATLREQARRRRMALEDYALALLEGPPAMPEASGLFDVASPEEWKRVTHAWIDGHRDWPLLTDEAYTRESIYEGRYECLT